MLIYLRKGALKQKLEVKNDDKIYLTNHAKANESDIGKSRFSCINVN